MRIKKGTIRPLFGLTQQEMADLLKISPSRWSMFESGKRKLPLEAMKEFAAILTHVESAKAKAAKKQPKPIQPNKETTQKLKLALVVSQHRQGITAKKIERLQKKAAMGKAALDLEGYFKGKEAEGYFSTIVDRANKDVQLGQSAEMIELQVKLKVLHYEETLLKTALEEL